MRWFWIDRFLEFQSGQRAVALKNVTLAEEQVEQYVLGHPLMPASLIIEGLAQTGGLLVAQQSDFQDRVVLAKVSQASFHEQATAGDTLIYTATMQGMQTGGALVNGTCHIEDRLQAEVDLFFAQLDDRFAGVELFEPAGLLQMLRYLRLFEVGTTPDGQPLQVPDHMLQAERAALGATS